MNRLGRIFDHLKLNQEKALITYIMAGDPDMNFSLRLMNQLVQNGTDIIELGFPFSEPMADGPVIQRAIQRSLAADTHLDQVLELVSRFRENNLQTPIILMGYLNPVYRMSYKEFAVKAAQSGVDGVLIVDCPVEYIEDLSQELKKYNIELIFLVTPTTSIERVRMIAKHAGGFLYYVSLKGVTGSKELNIMEVKQKIEAIRPNISIPIVVGFGIKNKESVEAIAQVADGVVIGSRIIEEIEKKGVASLTEIANLVHELKEATLRK